MPKTATLTTTDTPALAEFTWDDLLNAAILLATKNPTHVDPRAGVGCKYTRTEGTIRENLPPCIVGQALEGLGVPEETRRKMDEHGANVGRDQFAKMLGLPIPDDYGGDYRYSARRVLSSMQGWQDSGSPWGRALEMALGGKPA